MTDPFVKQAEKQGLRSRAAFKLREIQERYCLLDKADVVIDLGCAPGGWSQVVLQTFKDLGKRDGVLVGIDLLPVEGLAGATFIQADFTTDEGQTLLTETLAGEGRADCVLSDMAPSMLGHRETDHLRTMALAEQAFMFAYRFLRPGGSFVVKILQGADQDVFIKQLRGVFGKVVFFKPKASRKESSEVYVVATAFKGDGSRGGGARDNEPQG